MYALAETRTPKLLNLFLDTSLTDQDVARLSRWDVVVLDMDQQQRHPALVKKLKQLNPSIKILAYISSSEIAENRIKQDKRAPGYKLITTVDPTWYMRRVDGTRAQWWPGAWLMDPTNASPKSRSGQRWNTFLPNFIKTELMPSGLWDGVFLDGSYGYASAFFKNIDINRDRKSDEDWKVDQAFFEGMTTLIQNVRKAIGPDKLIMNNSGERYAWLVNGTLFENVPQYGWTLPFNLSQEMNRQNQTPVLTAINTNTANREEPYNYQAMRLGLATALIADTYYSFDAGDAKHHRTWWYDEYAVDMGSPSGTPLLLQTVSSTAGEVGVWGHMYTKGYVIANPTNQPVEVMLPEPYQRLNGIQDPITNNGQVVSKVKIWPNDGVVLVKPAVK